MQKNIKIIIIIAVIIGATGITIGTIALTQPETFDPALLLFAKPTKVSDNIPTSNQPLDIITNASGSETIDWILYDDIGSGQYRVWANDTNDNYYVWVNWTNWSNDTNLAITINRTAPGVYNYTIEYDDSANQLGIPHTVIVTITDAIPTSYQPPDILVSEIGSETINWTLYDDFGPGQYRIWANDTNDNYYVLWDWTLWTNDTSLDVAINRSALGTYNYTIEYNDSYNNFGIPDNVIVTIATDAIPTSYQPGDILTSASGLKIINWSLYDDFGPGQYRVWANDTNDNYYIWMDWSPWINATSLDVPINFTDPGIFNYTIEYDDFNNQLGIPDTVIVTIIDGMPTSNHPAEDMTVGGGSVTIPWILYDDFGPGQYRVWANDTNDNYYVLVDWTTWTNNTNLNVPINQTAAGTYNYTIEFYDNYNNFGNPDTIIINIFLWTWMAGNNSQNLGGTYGTKGVADANNIPGARRTSITWTDSIDTLWLFGGQGYDNNSNSGYLNDLWKFDGVNWTWVSGSSLRDQPGTYGTKGVPDAGNTPGARASSMYWIDSNDTLWLFGGQSAPNMRYNDLWKFDGVNWTWVSGDSTANQYGIYGTKGVASATNKPGTRSGGYYWIDSNDILWLFGGYGYAFSGIPGELNDLWKFDGVNWTWVSGNNLTNQQGFYGTKGVADTNNIPGGRDSGGSWIDSNDNFWLFGGAGYDSTNNWGYLNDLWKFDGVNWTWVSGDSIANQYGYYGTKGVASATNKPGARVACALLIDSNDTLWCFGGYGYPTAGNADRLNDLWKFNIATAEWTWVSGSNFANQMSNYGTLGVANSTNILGGRTSPAFSIDSNDNLWFFGGFGYVNVGGQGNCMDLWKFGL